MSPATDRHRTDVAEPRRVFVAHHQVGQVPGGRAADHQQIVRGHRQERQGKQDPSLDAVDGIVQHRREILDADYDAGVLVTNFNAHALGAGQDVLMAQVIERSAGAEEFIAPGDRARLGRETVQHEAFFAETGGGQRLVMQVGAVQAAIDMRQIIIGITDLEIAPQPVTVILLQLEVELAKRRCALFDGAVVAVGRVVIVGIDAPKQRAR
jgi:hypothetical protein